MGKREGFECHTCGSLIDPETGDTYFKPGSNAEKYSQMKAKNEKLRNELNRLSDENDRLKGEKKGNGKERKESADAKEALERGGFFEGWLDSPYED